MERFEKGGAELIPMSPQQVTDYLKQEEGKWQKVVKERGIKAG